MGIGNDSDDMRNEIESLVLDTRTHATLIHPQKKDKSQVLSHVKPWAHERGWGLLNLFVITIRCLRRWSVCGGC